MARIIGLLISGASVRLFSIGIACYVGHLGYTTLVNALDKVQVGLNVL